jgi:microcystin-dependent protein
MASPPFSLNITSPANTDIAANFPTLDRSDKDVIQSWLLTCGNNQGRNNFLELDIQGGSVFTGAAPTPGAGIAAIYYDSTQTLQEYRGDKAVIVQLSVPVGTILPFTGSSAPNGYVLCFGQAISRTTFSVLNAIYNALSYPYGNGDGSTTFNVPDLRGRQIVGVDNMGGTAANRVTSSGSGIAGTTLGATGGTQNLTILQANLPNVNWTVTDPGHTHNLTYNGVTAASQQIAVAFSQSVGGSGNGQAGNNALSVASATTGITVASGGSGTALQSMNPTIMLNYILRVF